jgi:hypothetical protein
MLNRFTQHIRQQLVGYIALFLALGGVSYAALKLPANSVGTKQLKNGAVTGRKVKPKSLLAKDFRAGQLPRGPRGVQGIPGKSGTVGNGTTIQGAQATNLASGPNIVDGRPAIGLSSTGGSNFAPVAMTVGNLVVRTGVALGAGESETVSIDGQNGDAVSCTLLAGENFCSSSGTTTFHAKEDFSLSIANGPAGASPGNVVVGYTLKAQ